MSIMRQLPNRWCEDWEDDPDRIACQEELKNLPKKYDERSARHNGLIGPGALLKEMVKEVNNANNSNS